MPLPTFAPDGRARPQARSGLSRSQVASRLELSLGSTDKLIEAGLLQPPPTPVEQVEKLSALGRLTVTSGELTVLRTAPRRAAYPDEGRDWIGYHADMTDREVDRASLGWWRSDPSRVVDNRLLVVTIATIPVAVYEITARESFKTRPGEDATRHLYAGNLLGRRTRTGDAYLSPTASDELLSRAEQIMASRLVAAAGGPVAYLGPIGATIQV